jgi:hypothetical protein
VAMLAPRHTAVAPLPPRCGIGLRRHDARARDQYRAPRRRGSRRRPTAVDPHVRPQPHRPRPRACRPTRRRRGSQVRALC